MQQQKPPLQPPKVSIIVPAYNAAEFLPACLDSLATQTLRDIEVIVVDDGSNDATLAIARRYAAEHAHFKAVSQNNAGVSVARNRGLALARGEFIAFVDADDVVEPVMYERMYAFAAAQRLEIAVCNAWFVDDGVPVARCFSALPEGVGRGDNWLVAQVARRAMKHYIWCHLYRRDFLLRERFAFVPRLVHQDIVWTNQVLLNARRVGSLDVPLYHYRHRRGSLSKPQTGKRRLHAALHYLNVVLLLDELGCRPGLQAEVAHAVRYQAADEGLGIFHIASKLEMSDRHFLFAALWRFRFGPLLLRNAQTLRQKRRVLQRWAVLCAGVAAEKLKERLFGFDRYTGLENAGAD